MHLNHTQIAQLLPHAGAMCLLDELLSCDPDTIRCRSQSHRRIDHPMRTEQGLGSANAIEYAAQAMALHAAVNASLHTPAVAAALPVARPHGVLASVRGVSLLVGRLDDIADDLIITARLHSGDALSAMYEFAVHAGDRQLVNGRASVLFVADAV